MNVIDSSAWLEYFAAGDEAVGTLAIRSTSTSIPCSAIGIRPVQKDYNHEDRECQGVPRVWLEPG